MRYTTASAGVRSERVLSRGRFAGMRGFWPVVAAHRIFRSRPPCSANAASAVLFNYGVSRQSKGLSAAISGIYSTADCALVLRQMRSLEHAASNQVVGGSNPSGRAIFTEISYDARRFPSLYNCNSNRRQTTSWVRQIAAPDLSSRRRLRRVSTTKRLFRAGFSVLQVHELRATLRALGTRCMHRRQEVQRNMPTRIATMQPHCSNTIRSRSTSAAKARVTSG